MTVVAARLDIEARPGRGLATDTLSLSRMVGCGRQGSACAPIGSPRSCNGAFIALASHRPEPLSCGIIQPARQPSRDKLVVVTPVRINRLSRALVCRSSDTTTFPRFILTPTLVANLFSSPVANRCCSSPHSTTGQPVVNLAAAVVVVIVVAYGNLFRDYPSIQSASQPTADKQSHRSSSSVGVTSRLAYFSHQLILPVCSLLGQR